MLWWLLSVSVNWSWFMVLLNWGILKLNVGRVTCKETWSKVWLQQLMLHKVGLDQVRLLHCGLFRLLSYVSIRLIWLEWAKERATFLLPCSIIYISDLWCWTLQDVRENILTLAGNSCFGLFFLTKWQFKIGRASCRERV
jgi:hypothetical protein